MRIKQKFSVNDKIKYFTQVAITEARKNGHKVSNKEAYASGFVQGAERGYSMDFNNLSKFEQLGQKAGVRAKEKAFKIKF